MQNNSTTHSKFLNQKNFKNQKSTLRFDQPDILFSHNILQLIPRGEFRGGLSKSKFPSGHACKFGRNAWKGSRNIKPVNATVAHFRVGCNGKLTSPSKFARDSSREKLRDTYRWELTGLKVFREGVPSGNLPDRKETSRRSTNTSNCLLTPFLAHWGRRDDGGTATQSESKCRQFCSLPVFRACRRTRMSNGAYRCLTIEFRTSHRKRKLCLRGTLWFERGDFDVLIAGFGGAKVLMNLLGIFLRGHFMCRMHILWRAILCVECIYWSIVLSKE